ncbi:homocysteine S-methyltransferase family protein [Rhodotorula paludigena]|uniref:homocysteine S-methyltransferase family protein n=1 Tax=Rhodotorula paludigena TaxID=86838 RepID=UPI00316B2781
MPGFSSIFPPERKVVVLDGGMGTTLQAPPFELGLDSALWSSELLATEPGRAQLDKLHRTWVDAGADVVETCTYQSTLPLFLGDRTSPSSAEIDASLQTMVSALPLACASCSSGSRPTPTGGAAVALSLGPYGSSLQPGQEYTGAYPPPFGPAATAAADAKPACSSAALQAVPLPLDAVRALGVGSASDEELHLAAWHLQRLEHFASVGAPTWDAGIKLLAFETVPSVTEILAIRRGVAAFRSSRPATADKPFYISLVFPRDTNHSADDAEAPVRFPDPALSHLPNLASQLPTLAQALFAVPREGDSAAYASPDGVGFNCTSPLRAAEVVRGLSSATLEQLAADAATQNKPWFFLYPDGGAIYDVVSRSWHHPAGLTDSAWAALVADAAGIARESGAWGGVGVGGCCKAGPGAIRELRKEVERRGWR